MRIHITPRWPGCIRAGAARVGTVALLLVLAAAHAAWAQQLEPRAYSASPTGVNFVGMGYTYSTGDVLFDPTLPFSDVRAQLNIAVPFCVRTFGLFGRAASAGLTTPVAWGSVEGNVAEERRRVERSGFGDVSMRLAVNLVGGPALSPREFATRKPATTLGASLVVTLPTGQYDSSKLINLGTNRWAFKPEVGLSHPWRRWWLEAYAGVWLFTTNDDFFGGQVRKQEPIGVVQGHVVRAFKTRVWAAFDATYYYGGETTLDGVHKTDLQSNSRAGVTLALPVMRSHSVKLGYARGVTARTGSKLETVAVAWQYFWFHREAAPAGR